jgi:hypothetical protein
MVVEHPSQGQSPADPVEALRAELLAVKQASGLSYARLGARTHYAKSSWERWINGKQFPPRAAVEGLAVALEQDPERLLALWEAADEARTDLAGTDDAQADGVPDDGVGSARSAEAGAAAGAPGPFWRRLTGRRRLLLAGALCLLGTAVSVAAVLAANGDSHDTSDTSARTAAATESPEPSTPQCRAEGCSGKDPVTSKCGMDGQTLTLTRNKDMVTYASKQAVVDADNSAGISFATPVHWGNDVYSPMVSVTGRMSAWACGTQPKGGVRECTRHMPVPVSP